MSYSQTYTGRVHISGSKTVSYPKSESGGTMSVSYSEYEDVNITINVDTERFDRNVGGCNRTIDALTGSVVLMNAAQCREIEESAEKISSTIINGFYGMIRSELSQQMIDLKNRFESQQLLLMQLGKRMQEYKEIMQADYARIASRYQGTFEELNKECFRRVHALDKASFELSQQGMGELVSSARLESAGAAAVYARDIPLAQTTIATSRLRSRVGAVIRGLRDYILQEETLRSDCEAIVAKEGIEARRSVLCPCLLVERDSLSGDGGLEQVPLSPEGLPGDPRGALARAIAKEPEGTRWEALSTDERSRVGSELERLMASEAVGDEGEAAGRVRLMMKRLWDADTPQLLAAAK